MGGARSGKSRLAEQRALAASLPVTYVATATAGDGEMAERIRHHQQRRPDDWNLVEEPLDLAGKLRQDNKTPQCFLVDCLTLWVSNWLMQDKPDEFSSARQELLDTLANTQHHVILVSNETGMGVIPIGRLSRDFVDHSGWLHQQVAALADNVILTVAGLPLPLKKNRQPCFNLD